MDEHKICFILCVNNEQYLQEAMFYIDRLVVPEGFTTDCIVIREAGSMAEGYQAAMEESDARYKVYMHQDVMIINKNFIQDCLDIFRKDEQIGMLGMVGSVKLPPDGVAWNNQMRCGKLYGNNVVTANITTFPVPIKEDYCQVEAVDGLLMMTAKDVDWRKDIFQGWDFYDVSQSMEMRRAGYKVVVPRQEEPWVIHDDGFLNMTNYKKWKKVFLQEYKAEDGSFR